MKVYQKLAGLVQSRLNCLNSEYIRKDKDGNLWEDIHEDNILALIKEQLPSGSGIDCGVNIDFDKSNGEKLVLTADYHCMDEHGGYAGWIKFKVVVTSSLQSNFNLNITGNFSSNKNAYGLKDYLYEIFNYALNEEVKEVVNK